MILIETKTIEKMRAIKLPLGGIEKKF